MFHLLIVSPIIRDFINQVKYIYVNICCVLCIHVIFWFDEILLFIFYYFNFLENKFIIFLKIILKILMLY